MDTSNIVLNVKKSPLDTRDWIYNNVDKIQNLSFLCILCIFVYFCVFLC